ncbi:unnamed protein product [Cuscuta epithymum]|uniref:Uncharacterized protein n=1 Tax=Cuscuta epithymum TaxID=186058 RepID=A0AAV0D6S8_9ASTE|nr:unnamed protein product [Cuscuta epithymum]CAH9147267.1 unnamed protein product [Cuscuta epithymum]
MASAVLASRNEAHWNERTLYMTPNSDNPPLFSGRVNHGANPSRYALNPTKRNPDSSTKCRSRPVIERNDSFHREYVIFRLGSCAGREIKELQQRLIFDLERVRGVLKRFATLELQPRAVFRRAESPSHPPPQPAVGILVDCQASGNAAGPNAPCSELSARKKSKGKLSGKKRSFPVVSEGDWKLPAAGLDRVLGSMRRRCSHILTKLMKHKFGWVFNTPVDYKGLGLHDYHLIIKRPMDLGTVKSRLDRYEYATPLDFAADVRLTFKNAMCYNPKGQDVHAMAELLLNIFDDMFTVACYKHEAEHKKAFAAAAGKNIWTQPELAVTSRSPPEEPKHDRPQISDTGRSLCTSSNPHHIPCLPAPMLPETALLVPQKSGKLSKPKAKDPNKREMTYEEKAKLGTDLQNLPQDRLDHMMHILKKRNSSTVLMEGDEIELDIATLDNETLWELDRFVGYQKKYLSKMKRQGLIIGENFIVNASQENIAGGVPPLQDPTAHREKKDESGEEDVDIGEESPMNNFSPVRIEKDVSEANSSSSTSSSSDSSCSGKKPQICF